MGKRKDSKGRVLKTGEGQRPNGTYEYRYMDKHGKRQRIYAKTLDALRKQEQRIRRDLEDGIDSNAGNITVSELVDKYIAMRRKFSRNTLRAYNSAINRIHAEDFGSKRANTVKKSDAIKFIVDLHDSGLKFNTIGAYCNVLRPAFEMAVDDDRIRKNPFKFTLGDILPKDEEERTALTKEEQETYMLYMRDHANEGYYTEMVILLETGLRVSELYGLTVDDVDFKNRCINVNKQLCRTGDKPYFVDSPKTESGKRYIPMSDKAFMAFKKALINRIQLADEMEIDGYKGFLFLDKMGKPKVAMHLQNYMRKIQKKLIAEHPDFPRVTPHVFRHTFCTNMQRAGLDIKSLQYLMGHSNASVTLDVYTHTDPKVAAEAYFKAAVNL